MEDQVAEAKPNKISRLAVVSMLVAVLLCSFFVYISIINKIELDNAEIERTLREWLPRSKWSTVPRSDEQGEG